MEPKATTLRVSLLYPLSIALITANKAFSTKRTPRSPVSIEIPRGPPNTSQLRRTCDGKELF
jgi:hypothetical protein